MHRAFRNTSLVEAQQLLAECRRVTKPGGVVRIAVPDLHAMVVDYLKGRMEMGIAPIESRPLTS
jgi:predicted SAM-dependent methyltransferase